MQGTQSSCGFALLVPLMLLQVSQLEWNACACGGHEVNPFLLWEFLNALEDSNSVVGLGPDDRQSQPGRAFLRSAYHGKKYQTVTSDAGLSY